MKKCREFFELLNNAGMFWYYLIVGIAYSVISIIAPSVSGELVNAVVYKQDDMGRNLLILIIVYVLQLIFSVWDGNCAQIFLANQKKKMRNRSFESVIKDVRLDREKISSFVSFMNNDIPDIAENYFQGIIDILKCSCIAIGSSVALMRIHWLLAVVIVGCTFLIVLLPNLLKKQVASCRKKYTGALEKFNTILASFLERTDIIRMYLYQKNAAKQVADENQKVEKQERRLRNCQVCVRGMTGFVQILKTVLVLTIGVYLIYIQDIKVGELLAAVQLAEILAAPVEVMAYLINGRNEIKPLVEQYKEILETEAANGNVKVEKIKSIQTKDLSYSAEQTKILDCISLTFEAGNKYMVTGKSGSGKTTLLRLIAKLGEEDYTGEIYINETEYGKVDMNSFYQKVGFVSQEPYLFWMSLEENILLGRLIKREDYLDIIKKLNLTYLIERFENQPLDEEKVSRLSGGEKQRISLARAMVGKPEVYLLDEVTSSLDEQNAYEIENMLLSEDAMLVHVCHKIIPELMEQYDEIICLD